MLSHQTSHRCFSRGPEEVSFLFEAIRNPKWLPLHLILAEAFSTSSPELLHVKSPGLPEMFLLGNYNSSISVVTFHMDLKWLPLSGGYIFFFFYTKLLHKKSPDLPEMFLLRF